MLETASQSARRANIERYRKILGKHLTAEERRFVERRLAEEQALLHKLLGASRPLMHRYNDQHSKLTGTSHNHRFDDPPPSR